MGSNPIRTTNSIDMKIEKYKNRYGNEYTFTLLDDGNIRWEGDFSFYRVGYPNDYTKAYEAYLLHGGKISLEEFKEEVHRVVYDKRGNYVGNSFISEGYEHLVESRHDAIITVDPSGGPYMTAGMDVLGKTIKEFKHDEKGCILIITECSEGK